jgi:hypothetical protein
LYLLGSGNGNTGIAQQEVGRTTEMKVGEMLRLINRYLADGSIEAEDEVTVCMIHGYAGIPTSCRLVPETSYPSMMISSDRERKSITVWANSAKPVTGAQQDKK